MPQSFLRSEDSISLDLLFFSSKLGRTPKSPWLVPSLMLPMLLSKKIELLSKSLSPLTYLSLHQFIQSNGILRLHVFLLLLLFLQHKPWGEGVAIDALITTARTLPEPAVKPLLNGLEEMPTDLRIS